MSLLNDMLQDLDRRTGAPADQAVHLASDPPIATARAVNDTSAAPPPGFDVLRWAGWSVVALACIAAAWVYLHTVEGGSTTRSIPASVERPPITATTAPDSDASATPDAERPPHQPAVALVDDALLPKSAPVVELPVASSAAPAPTAQDKAETPKNAPAGTTPSASSPPRYLALENVEEPQAKVAAGSVKTRVTNGPSAVASARAQIDAGDLAIAEKTLSEHLGRVPDDRVARELQIGLMLRGGRHADAIAAIDEGLAHHPDSPNLRLIKARLLAEQGDNATAITLLRDLIASDKPNVDALLMLGALYQQQRDYARAVAVYRRLLTDRPSTSIAWVGLAIGLDGLGDPAALKAYDRALVLGGLPAAAKRYARQRKAVLGAGNG